MAKFFLLVALAILSVASARVATDAGTPEFFENSFKEGQKYTKQMEKSLYDSVGVKNNREFTNKMEQTLFNFAKQLDDWNREFKVKANEFIESDSVKEIRNNVEGVINDLKSKNPEGAKVLEKASENLQAVVAKFKEIQNSPEAKKITELSNKLIETTGETIKKAIDETKKKAPK